MSLCCFATPVERTALDTKAFAAALSTVYAVVLPTDRAADADVFASCLDCLASRFEASLAAQLRQDPDVYLPDEVHDLLCDLTSAKESHIVLKRHGLQRQARDVRLLVRLASYRTPDHVVALCRQDPDGVYKGLRAAVMEAAIDASAPKGAYSNLTQAESDLVVARLSGVHELRDMRVRALVSSFVSDVDKDTPINLQSCETYREERIRKGVSAYYQIKRS